MNSFSQAEKNNRFGKLVSNSSIAQYRSSKANSEEAGIIKVNSLLKPSLVFIYYVQLQPLLCLNTGTWVQNISDPAREVIECGVQLARGFPPRSKWTYGEVFHPAVVPQPPFNINQANSFSLAVRKNTKNKNKTLYYNNNDIIIIKCVCHHICTNKCSR